MADLLISVGDYVILQEGQVDQPKIVLWDDIGVADVVGELSNDLLITVFDAIVTEDPVQPAIVTTVALVVFDTVRVQEGQADSDSLNISVTEDVTLSESVALIRSKLNIAVSDVVTVVDAIEIFAQGPVGIVLSETVVVQEQSAVMVTVYITVSDAVLVVDGALNMDINETITVSEDVSVVVSRLVLDVAETVTVAESVALEGPAAFLTPSVFEDVVVSDASTVLLTTLTPEVADTVTVVEAVTVSITSINLSIDVSDTVTVAEALVPQTNPMQINEFTEIIVTESATVLTGLLLIETFDVVTVLDALDIYTLPIQTEHFETVTVNERVALRIGRGGRKRHDLTVLGAGE